MPLNEGVTVTFLTKVVLLSVIAQRSVLHPQLALLYPALENARGGSIKLRSGLAACDAYCESVVPTDGVVISQSCNNAE